jgi:CRISPR-associated endonuclease Cas1
MNALWLSRICDYKKMPEALQTAGRIIDHKIDRQSALLKKYKLPIFSNGYTRENSISDLLLREARSAKYYWNQIRALIPCARFRNRNPHGNDVTNTLLDIGYHNLVKKVEGIFEKYDCSMAIGIFHKPRTVKSKPLAYDLVELFRSDIVDAEILRFFRLKKKPVEKIDNRQIAFFINNLNKKYERKFYLKNFHRCHKYSYYMELQILKFIEAVNHKKIFEPFHIPNRHEVCCP